MEGSPSYVVEITPDAEKYYLQLLSYLYGTHTPSSADEKAKAVLDMAMSLSTHPNRGRIEDELSYLNKGHRFLVYPYSDRNTIKVIYFVEEGTKKVYVTDFFPSEKDPSKIKRRA
ncbi:MAG: hypothetical protein COC01_09465 [Bacteroidetes bacterium]|nr:MAG: hypothetical protein COC01_09465 [Bacteroidota bacterium]